MNDRIALVTGSSRGIGLEIAVLLAEDMDGVAVHFKENEKAAAEVVTEIEKKGKSAKAFSADLTSEQGARDLIRDVETHFGRLDVLVNNFGPIIVKPWQELTTADWEGMYRSVFLSAAWGIAGVLPGMRERGWGRIINIGYNRVEQLTAFSKITAYAVAKTALLILTRSAAVPEIKNGITVNMVSPGLIEGGMMPAGGKIDPAYFGKKADVAEAVRFLASDKAAHITGTNLIVAGAWKL
ncbi:MAG: SDR family NAD(P)-dependent oxidoreductase [Candidatus Aminicenantes bacterium]|nr:SDR family NAD(P)-dependent oxidoreductase [Candidatus Aminicenantes bacterium]